MQSSPFENILHTNAIPSDADCQRIRDFIAGPLKEAADLTTEIARMQNLIDELTQKRDALNDSIAAHLAMVSPARRLPEDIVRDVFVACLPAHRNPFILSNESPLLLCQICSHWRRLALSTPRLWAAVHVVIPKETKAQVLAGLLKDWLNRSGVLPLSISVVFSQVCTREDDAVSPALGLLTSFSRRWGNIQFDFPHHGCFAAFENLCPDDVPMLQTITVHGLDRSLDVEQLDDSLSYQFMSFLDTPSLRSVTVGYVRELRTLQLPWANLNVLVVEDVIPCDDAIAILRQCPALEACALAIGPWIPTIQESISLPYLRFLTISGMLESAAGSFFALLDVPSLRSLAYSDQSWPSHSPPLSPLLAGSLEHFTLTVTELPGDVHKCLADMPLLQYLDIVINRRSQEAYHEYVVKQLIPSGNSPASVLCPALRSLVLLGLNETVSDDALLQLVRGRTNSRPQGVARLSQLIIIAERDKQTDILPLLQEEISLGLVISLEYRPLPPPPLSPEYQFLVYSPREGPGGYLLA